MLLSNNPNMEIVLTPQLKDILSLSRFKNKNHLLSARNTTFWQRNIETLKNEEGDIPTK